MEVRVTDPTHPLFGRRFPLARLPSGRVGCNHVLAVYRLGVYLRLPVSATDLGAPDSLRIPSKLTAQAVAELITLSQSYRLSCLSLPKHSGHCSAQRVDAPSSTS